MDYSRYDKIISDRLCTFLIIGGIITIGAIFSIFLLIKNKPEEKVLFGILIILLFSIIVGISLLIGNVFLDSMYDLKNRSYIIHEGTFMVVEDEKTPSRGCSVILDDGTRLDTRRYVLKAGNYKGCIVYGEKTMFVVELETQGD